MPTEQNPQDKSNNQPNISQQELIDFLQNIINQLNNIIKQLNNNQTINLPSKNELNSLRKDSDKFLNSLTSQIRENNEQISSAMENKEWEQVLDEFPVSEKKTINSPQPRSTFLTKIKSIFTRPILAFSLIFAVISLIFIVNFNDNNTSLQVAKNENLELKETPIVEPIITENIEEKLPEDNLNNLAEKPNQNLENNQEEPTKIIDQPSEIVTLEKSNLEQKNTLPELELTPEQSLIVSIQNQVAEITKKYADGLILGIKANFNTSYLTITINDSWYEISQNEQNKLSQEILEKAQILDFYKLKIIDLQGNLVARNPIVGNEMIIVRR